MRRRLLPCIYQEHADDGWKNTIIGMTRIWSMVLYYKERVPKGLREKVMQSSLPHPDVPVPEYHDATTQGFLDEIAAYAATIEESEHQLAAGKANIEESEHQLPADEANTEESEHQSASSETTNEQLVADPWRSTLMERGDGYRVVLFDKSRLLNDYCDRRGLCSRQPRMLKEFKKFTTIFGYMPYDERYQLPVGTQDTVTLDEALRLLATTPASQQGEINGLATSHHAEDGLERASSKSENIQPQETGAYTHQDELNDHDETTENHDGSSTSNNPPNQNKILHVLIGKQPEDQFMQT
ncbi:hypothetical protein PtB15_16B315 [Puccinia triticina]|nr:hypothetical protein PtB15_16B315 [Puccinia triticina]